MRTTAHKIRLNPTKEQIVYFRKACGTARFAWNWGLNRWQEYYKIGQKTTGLDLKKEFNSLKQKEFPWVYEVTKYASQQPFIHLQKAYVAFFKKQRKAPKFKKKGERECFYVGGDQIKIDGTSVHIPLLGWVKLRESLRFEGKIISATISCKADKWFVSFGIQTEQRPAYCESQAKVGVDLGIKALATLSSGKVIEGSKFLEKKLSKLKRLARKLSKKEKGSKNREKHKRKLAKLHWQITNQRQDALQKLTTQLTDEFKYICIEDLKVSEMLKNKRLSRLISQMGFYEFKRQLVYKAELKGNIIFVANKWFPSSKMCSKCGSIKEDLKLSDRVYVCENCNLEIDRDLNAALKLESLISTDSSAGIKASGQDGNVVTIYGLQQPAWMNEELAPV